MRFKRFRFNVLLGTVAGILAMGTIIRLESGNAANHPSEQPVEKVNTTALSPHGRELLNQFSEAFESAAAKVNPSVVAIYSEQVRTVENPFASGRSPLQDFFGDEFFKRFFGGSMGDQREVVRGLGSGVIVTTDGYILTNNHVVDGAEKVTVMLNDKAKHTAKVVGRDKQTDLAVIKIDASDLPAATLGNSDTVKIGEWVIAVGNPFQLMHTVTAGIISAKGRSSVNLADYEDFLQTDASINPGNSGGALADLDGNVVGINTAILSPAGGNVGIGFAVPITMAKRIMHQLIADGKVTRGYLGLVPQDIDEALAKALKLRNTQGVLVADVSEGGPAGKAGVQIGDIILQCDGVAVENSLHLRNLVAAAAPGSKVSLTLRHEGSERVVEAILDERPTGVAATEHGDKQEESTASAKLGLSVEPLIPDVARQLRYTGDTGVVISRVTPASPADEAGLQRGDLIKEVNRTKVTSEREFWADLAQAGKEGTVALLVRRGETKFFVALQLSA